MYLCFMCVCGGIGICILTIHKGSMVSYPHCISVIIAGAGTNGGETGRLPKDGHVKQKSPFFARCEKINAENMREPRLTAALPPSPGGWQSFGFSCWKRIRGSGNEV